MGHWYISEGRFDGISFERGCEGALSQMKMKIYQGINDDSIKYSESGYHSFMSDFLFKKNDEKFVSYLYMSFFLDPNNSKYPFQT